MKKVFLIVLTFLVAGNIFFLSCTATQLLTAAETEFAVTNWPGTSPEELKTGLSLYRNKCGKCHYLYKPEKYSADRWNELLPGMAKKSNLSGTEEKMILKYVITKRKISEKDNGNRNEP